MPATIRVLAALTPDRRADLERVLSTLQAEGYSVTVLPDAGHGEPETGMGYRVVVDAPGLHAVARLRVDATASEWATTLDALRPRPKP